MPQTGHPLLIEKDSAIHQNKYTFKIEVQLFRPLPRLRSVAEKAREGTKCDRVYRQYKK